MRTSYITAALSLFALTSIQTAFAEGVESTADKAAKAAGVLKDVKESSAAKSADATKDVVDGTVFDGQNVPKMTEINGETIDDEIQHGYWLVEFFSPYCGHCKHLAPTWQTLYEFYYTSNPLPATQENTESQDLNSFTKFYNFRFAKLDCVAFGTACTAKNVTSFPTIILFKDGTEVDRSVGAKKMDFFAKWIETTLESIKPGSRPIDGVQLPKPGATSVDPKAKAVKANPQEVKEKPAATSSRAARKAKPTTYFSKSKETPNKKGVSVSLTAETFQKYVTSTRDGWFVKFYAPWCHHCQAMAPNWLEMARDMKEKLNVGDVNCEVEKRLCKDVGVRGYPTLLFFRDGERIEYDGLRGVGDLISYGNQLAAIGEGIQDVDAAAFKKMEETEEVIFVYFYDHATTTEDFMALERLTLGLVGHGKLVKTNDKELYDRFKISTWPRLMVSRDGKPSYYPPLAPNAMRDKNKVLNWMRTVWLPLVPELTASNAREIMDGKLVVLGILNRERSDEFIMAKRELKNAAKEWIDKRTLAFELERQELRDAKQLRIEEAEDRNDQRALRAAKGIRINMDEIDRKEVGFAWVDGVFWERWIRTTFGISVKDDERVIINDEDNRRYWDNTITGNPIIPSRTSILETLSKVVASPPKIAPKSTTSSIERVFFELRNGFSGHPWLGMGVLFGLLVSVAFWGRNRIRKGRAFGTNTGGFFQLGEKDGLLGGPNGGGKTD